MYDVLQIVVHISTYEVMNKKARYKLIFNRRKKLNNSGEALIELRVTLNRKVYYYSTNIYIEPKQWNGRTEKINAKHQNNIRINRWLQYKIDKLENFEMEQEIKGIPVSIEDLKTFLKNESANAETFPDWCEKVLKDDATSSRATREKKEVFIRRLRKFNNNLSFNNINYTFMREFDNFLHKERSKQTNKLLKQVTIHGQMKILRFFLGIALRERRISYIPEYRIKKGESIKEALTEAEIERIENVDLSDNFMLNKIKDIFLFSSYTALRFSDIERLNSENIRTTDKGIELYISQTKVDKPVSLPLYKLFNGKPEKIFKKYLDFGGETIFETPTNQAVNRNLKIIKGLAKIEKPLTFHISRHTCLTLIGKKTGNPYLVMKIAGHSDIKTSMKYTQGVIDEGLYDLL